MKKIKLFARVPSRIVSISEEMISDISSLHCQYKGKMLQVRDITNPKRHVIINFDLSGRLRNICLGTEHSGAEIKIMERSFEGKFYVYFGNCKNLYSPDDEAYSYYDYYNQEIREDYIMSKLLVDTSMAFLKSLAKIKFATTDKIIFVNRRISENKIMKGTVLSKISMSLINILQNGITKYGWAGLKKENLSFNKVYSTSIGVLPPEVRPDQNPLFAVVQMTHGCRLQFLRGPCKFCSSFRGIAYKEDSIIELKKHIEQVKKFTGHDWRFIKKIFLSDADPLNTKIDSEFYFKFLNKTIPGVSWFESFVSTPTILSKSTRQWKRLMKLGLKKLYWGVESADDVTLKILGKAQDKKSLYLAAARLNSAGISYAIIVMSGIGFLNPVERKDSDEKYAKAHLIETSKFINDCKCPIVYISRFVLDRKSEIYNLVNAEFSDSSVEERENEHRAMVKMISHNKKNILIPNREVRGSYGVQFV